MGGWGGAASCLPGGDLTHPAPAPPSYTVLPSLLSRQPMLYRQSCCSSMPQYTLASATCGQQHSVSACDLHCHLHLRPDGFQCSEDEVRVCSRQLYAAHDPAFAAFIARECPHVIKVSGLLWQKASNGRFCTTAAACWSLSQLVDGDDTVLDFLLRILLS